MTEVDPAAVIDREGKRIGSSRPVVPAGHLHSVLGGREIDDDTWIRADPGLVTSVEGGRLILRVGRRRLVVPDRIGDAVAAVTEAGSTGSPVMVGALPELDTESRAVFARRLVREAMAFVVEPPGGSARRLGDPFSDAGGGLIDRIGDAVRRSVGDVADT